MEILQHGMTGELYGFAYLDGTSMADPVEVVGPLTAQEAIRVIDGAPTNGEAGDVEWAKAQPWAPWSGEQMARMCADSQDALYQAEAS